MTMRCGEARRVLWMDQGPREVTEASQAAEAHVRTCTSCQRFVADQEALATLLRDRAPRVKAPAQVHQRIMVTLANERARPVTRWNWKTGVAAAVLIVGAVAGGLWATRVPATAEAWRPALTTIADDHIATAQNASFVSSDSQAVRAWLNEQLDFATHVPQVPGSTLEGARLCFLNGRRAAALQYLVDGHHVSFYVMPADASDPTRLAPAEFVGGADRGYEFVAWRGNGLIHALVGDLPQDELRGMARYCLDLPADGRDF